MKKLVVLAVLVTATAHAEVDYSRCFGFGSGFPLGVTVGSDNQVTIAAPATQKSVSTEGNKTTYEIQMAGGIYGNSNQTTRIVIERDSQGRIASVTNGQAQPNATQLAQLRRSSITNMARLQVPNGNDGTLVYNRQDRRFETVNLDRLSVGQLRAWGVTDVTPQQLRDMRSQWHKDARTQRRLQSVYERMYSNMPVNMYLGTKTTFRYNDNACTIATSSSLNYNSENNAVTEQQTFDSAKCPDVQAVYQRHADTIQQCQITGGFGNRTPSGMDRLNQDMIEKGLGNAFSSAGYGAGTYSPASIQPGVVITRDQQSGLGIGGIGGGIGGIGMYGYGLGGFGMYGFGMYGMGAPLQNLQMMQMMCQYYGNGSTGQSSANSSGGGAATEPTAN